MADEIQGPEHEKPPQLPSFLDDDTTRAAMEAAVAAVEAKRKPKKIKKGTALFVFTNLIIKWLYSEIKIHVASKSKNGADEWVSVSFTYPSEIVPTTADELWNQLTRSLGTRRQNYNLINFDTGQVVRPFLQSDPSDN